MILTFDNDPEGRAALAARRWYAKHGPQDLQPLPLGYAEREDLKRERHQKQGNASYMLALYARSLDQADYDFDKHPTFEVYASGVMASKYAPPFFNDDEDLRRRFPPRPLLYLGPGVVWVPPKRERDRPRRRQPRFA